MTKPTLVATVAVVLAAPLSLSAQNPLVQSLKGVFDITKTNIMATAEILDDEMYAFRPTDEVRTAGQILAHIADGQFSFCGSAAGEAGAAPENFEQTRTRKAEIKHFVFEWSCLFLRPRWRVIEVNFVRIILFLKVWTLIHCLSQNMMHFFTGCRFFISIPLREDI